ncbi:alpha-mannosidase [Lacticaseibacillus nasuensis]|uniref:alpha-mannosidase n=1 Tax=Lacticaseibacillus nasuensis TaxID=944671 RepID=UPI002246F23E|nr:alpha-mannosidase [Lacticaseibacillus nasuensis]MCX2456401.1 alpha-mannosidase [Lacticaseibacillus nasuensis]
MAKKKVFIISHSHWDREWYMAYEKHHMRLITLMDDLFHLFETDPKFDSFHLDGQTIILDDYLAVRPEKRDELAHWIKAGKLRIGPFYILQDDFLISGEANTRNTLYGLKASHQWGAPVPLGYFPDTFGNMGQTAQMMKLAHLDTAAWGRGVTPTGFNNQTSRGKFDSTYSEMWWEGPDGSKILGILFANWYSNGNEIPAEPEAAKAYWTKHLADAERYAATDNLLFMNGVDHQPVQQNLTQAIELANQLFPDYEFIHSNFPAYIKALKADLPADLSTIHGELTSQATDGWYTLANTASSRIYLKQQNVRTERLLENEAEPLLALSGTWTPTNQDRLDYAWRTLLQNNPHDSICGCSVDPVHRGMMARFENAQAVGESVRDTALAAFVGQIDTSACPAGSKPFVLLNTTGATKQESVTVRVEYARAPFSEGKPDAQYAKLEALRKALPTLAVVDSAGHAIPSRIAHSEVRFGYDLPDHTFRVPYMALYLDVEIAPQLPAFSWATYALVAGTPTSVPAPDDVPVLENDRLRVSLAGNGELTVTDRQTGAVLPHALTFEDTGDIGNEYVYRQSADQQTVLSTGAPISDLQREHHIGGTTLRYTQTLMVPVSADAQLAHEQRAVIDMTVRTAGRSKTLVPLALQVTLTLPTVGNRLAVSVTGNNQAKDHRIRALIDTGIAAAENRAESIYEVVTRDNTVPKTWQNPTHPEHQQAFVELADAKRSVVVGNYALHEYEVMQGTGTIGITLLRCIGEMGDWGYFPTPEAQCLGEFHAEFSLALTDGSDAERLAAYQADRAAQVPVLSADTGRHTGTKAATATYLTVDNPAFTVTATYHAPASDTLLVRGYNLTGQAQPVTVTVPGKSATLVDFTEEALPQAATTALRPAEIRTYAFK